MNQERVVFDLDGTLALIDHRRHMVECQRPNWPSFFRACAHDKPNRPVIRTAEIMRRAGLEIWIVSGRSDEVRRITEKWLKRHSVPYDQLIMRRAGDRTPDHTLKARWVAELNLSPENVLAVYDDRDSVVAMWRRRGFACFQVAPGDF